MSRNEPERVTPGYVRRRLDEGAPTLLVCAYEKEVGFRKYPIEGAIPFGDLRARLADLPRDHEIVFY